MHTLLLNQSFHVHGVGQGLFYSGSIIVDNVSQFRFVFDCGSLNTISAQQEVEQYLRQNFPDGNGELDLLIVSHFDEDHINFLPVLLNNIRVKKIVTPFISMEERLVLALRVASRNKTGQADELTLSNILDPDGLTRYLSDDGELTVIDSDPENPPFNIEEGNRSSLENTETLSGATFDFPNAQIKQSKIPIAKGTILKKTIKDSSKGTVTMGGISIMEFLFYRKDVGEDDKAFFKKVYDLFVAKHSSEFKNPKKPATQELVDAVKSVSSAREIKDIFREAKTSFSGTTISTSRLTDMNTTALCLLHHNVGSLYQKAKNQANPVDLLSSFRITTLVKSATSVDVNTKNWQINEHYLHPLMPSRIPNTMLTSDAFLLTESDVNEFLKRYRQYWNRFWLFQIPHHGAERNTNLTLLRKLSVDVYGFINYGIEKTWGGSWRHPSPKLLENLMFTDLQLAFLRVNENTGLNFRFIVHTL